MTATSDAPRRVLVVGVPRSGTTWIARMLAAAPDVDYFHEPDSEMFRPHALWAKQRFGLYPILDAGEVAPRYGRLWDVAFDGRIPFHRLEVATRRLSALDADLSGPEIRHRSARPRALAVDGFRRGAPIPLATKLRLRVAAALSAHALPRLGHGPARTRVVKTVFGVLAAPWLEARYQPRICLVHRHPFGVVASRLGLGWTPDLALLSDPSFVRRRLGPLAPDTIERARRTADPIAAFGYHVAAMTRWLRAGAGLRDAVAVQHEALCDDSVVGFRALYGALGLRWHDAVERQLRAHDKAGADYQIARRAGAERDKWRRLLSADQVQVLERCFADFEVDPHQELS